jgi:2-dehydro-3-deoxy-D-arabinonate dehydratase
MQVAKYAVDSGSTSHVGLVEGDRIRPLASGAGVLSELLHAENPQARLEALSARAGSVESLPLASVKLLAPVDLHEVWGAGVTYERSKVARQEESEGAARFYDLVYRADRPELFFKATPSRVVGPGSAIRVRRDTHWCVPEPELGLVLSPELKLVGYTIGNDVSARDIEGENPLYLPQAKVYDACCSLGPWITLEAAMPPADKIGIHLAIERGTETIVRESTSVARMARRFNDLIFWLGIDNLFPDGVILLTGTGIVPPDGFTLEPNDVVRITINGIGTLTNSVTRHQG